jgi:CheY-like chemotaxis protein
MPGKILIVEDCAADHQFLTFLLRYVGEFTIVIAEDGLRGLILAESERPDLIITDIHLPGLSGLELIASLREQEAFLQVPVIVVSACVPMDAEAALKAGANHVLQKPVDIELFLECSRRMLSY